MFLLSGAGGNSDFAVSLNETNRMMRMVTDLLSSPRIDSETSQLDIESTNFTAFITFILKPVSG